MNFKTTADKVGSISGFAQLATNAKTNLDIFNNSYHILW